MRQKLKLLMRRAGEGVNSGSDRVECTSEDALLGSKETDVETGSQNDDILLEPLPRAADILAELPDYPDSEEEEQKVRNIMKELCDLEETKLTPDVVLSKNHHNAASAVDTIHHSAVNTVNNLDLAIDTIHHSTVDTVHHSAVNTIHHSTVETVHHSSVDTIHHSTLDTINHSTLDNVHRSPVDTINHSTLETVHHSAVDTVHHSYEEGIENLKQKTQKKIVTSVTSRDEKRELSPEGGAVRKSKRSRIEGPQTLEERYVNKAGEFVTGFDPTSEEAKYRRHMRMQRFGRHTERPKGAEALDEYNSSGEENNSTFDKRPEALHLYGTDDLSTDDILEYFREFSPHHIEWLDDSHCNVVWSDPHSVKRALLNLSKKYTEEELKKRKDELKEREKNEPGFVLIAGTLDRPYSSDTQWRLAIRDHDKAHLLFMRYCTTGDTKKKGNYYKSRFYNLYGNPNLGTQGIYNTKYQRPQKPKMVPEPSLVNEELEKKKKKNTYIGDLRKHLNSGKIDIDKIQKDRIPVEKQTIELTRHDSSDSSTSTSSSSTTSSSSSESESDSSTSASEGSEPQIISSRKVQRAIIQKKITLKIKEYPRQIPARRKRLRSPPIKRALSSSESEEVSKHQKTVKLKPNDLRAKLATRCRR